MATKNENSTTPDRIVSAKYQAALGIRVGSRIVKPALTQQVRTVTTSAKEGSLGLRYAPHNPKVTDVSTSS